ncbi:hypothetical protein L0F63_001126 [Massospora cicadina]|nr:hypothetical protein L0F63_001126 [Massospora cicadina]
MKEPQKFPKILAWTVGISAFTFVSIAALCYATFGDKVDAVVLLNLPRENKLVQGVQLLYSLAITFSVPLQLFPALRILESYFFPRSSGKSIPLVNGRRISLFHLRAVSRATPDQIAISPVPISNGPYQLIVDGVLAMFGVMMMIYVSVVNIASWSAPEASGPDFCS